MSRKVRINRVYFYLFSSRHFKQWLVKIMAKLHVQERKKFTNYLRQKKCILCKAKQLIRLEKSSFFSFNLILNFIHAEKDICVNTKQHERLFPLDKTKKRTLIMIFDNEQQASTTGASVIRNRRHIPPPSAKGAKPAGYWVRKKMQL